jgi:hypothetical protein
MNITTIEELKKHIGEFLVFEIRFDNITNCSWIQKLQVVGDKIEWIPHGQTEIYHLECWSILSAEIYPNVKAYSGKYGDNKDAYAPYHTNAQNIIRTPTKDEMKKYRDFWRKYKVLGHF